MKIVLLDGALANQMTQYIFARCLQKETNDTVYLDDLFFHNPHSDYCESAASLEKHQYQLNKFSNLAKTPLMSEYFDPDVWEEIKKQAAKMGRLDCGSHLPQILKDNGLNFFMIEETSLSKFDGMIAKMPFYYCIPEMLAAQGNVYYYGWFTNGGWFMRHAEMFRHELELPPLTSEADLEMEKEIDQSFSIGVHIRCGGGYKASGIAFPAEYYKEQIQNICSSLKTKRNGLKKTHIFIFADDIAWCKQNFKKLGLDKIPYPVTFGQQDRGPDDNQNDMKLLSMCDVMIINNSVYGYMAALLNDKPNKIVINPIKSRGVF